MQRHAAYARVLVLQQVYDQRVLEDLDTRVLLNRDQCGAQRCDQSPGYLLSCRVPAGMGDPVPAVTTLARQCDLTIGPTVELGPEGHELTNPGRALGNQDAHRFFVADSGACYQGVPKMLLRRVRRIQGGSDSTLRPLCRALRQHGLGDEQYAVDALAQTQCGGEAGNTRANDDDVSRYRPPRLWRRQPGRDTKGRGVENV